MKPMWLYFDDSYGDREFLARARMRVLSDELAIEFIHYPPVHEEAFQQLARELEARGVLRGVLINHRNDGTAEHIRKLVRRFSPTLPVWMVGVRQRPKEKKRITLDARWGCWDASVVKQLRQQSPPCSSDDQELVTSIRAWGRCQFSQVASTEWSLDRQRLSGLNPGQRNELKATLLDMAGYEIHGGGSRKKDISLGNSVTMMYYHLPTGEVMAKRGFGQHGLARLHLRCLVEEIMEFRKELGMPPDHRLEQSPFAMVHGLVFHDVPGYSSPIGQLSTRWTSEAIAGVITGRWFHPLNEECQMLA